MDETPKLIICNCHDCEHQFILSADNEDKLIFMHIHLRAWEGFFRRLWAGLRYAFGHRSRYGEWDEVIINAGMAAELAKYFGDAADDWMGKTHTFDPAKTHWTYHDPAEFGTYTRTGDGGKYMEHTA